MANQELNKEVRLQIIDELKKLINRLDKVHPKLQNKAESLTVILNEMRKGHLTEKNKLN